jgi:ATP-dependent protease HslVU (ClpYQ) peptidase subunit
MTVAVAVTKHDRTVLAADSLVNFGGQRFPSENARFTKIHRVGESLLAWAGWTLYGELLTAYLASSRPPELATESQVFDFFIGFWRAIRSEYTLEPGERDRHVRQPFADLDSTFLLANRHGIFRIARDMDVTQFCQYSAVGSGSAYALGALRVLYDQHDDPAVIARRAVGIGIEYDVYCGGEIDAAEVGVDSIPSG